jgi:Kef-type K+ transport system membrane component KefB
MRNKRFTLLALFLTVMIAGGAFAPAGAIVDENLPHDPDMLQGEDVLQVTGVADEGDEAHAEEDGHHVDISTFLWIALLLLFAKLSGLVERFGQPAVLGELVMGVLLGNAVLLGIPWFEAVKTDAIITFLAEFGVIVLLFMIGLETNVGEMRKVGARALAVAVIGVVVPFAGAYFVGPMLLPGLSSSAYLFLGAALTATSVGITARVFQDLGKLQTPEAKIVLGAAVFDDVFGLVILAVVSAIATVGTVSAGAVGIIIGKAVLFLVGAIVVGQVAAPRVSNVFSKIHTGAGMKFTIAVTFMFVFAYLAKQFFGLEAIIGAFAAGLVLDPVHFKSFVNPALVEDIRSHTEYAGEKESPIAKILEQHSHKHVEELMEPLAFLLVPLFFVRTGMDVDLRTLGDTSILLVAGGITVIAFLGKYVAGFVAGNVNKHIVGIGMVPRGEVGLIFAAAGRSLGVISEGTFSVIVIMVIVTTLLAPPLLSVLLRKGERELAAA